MTYFGYLTKIGHFSFKVVLPSARCQSDCESSRIVKNVMSEPSGHITGQIPFNSLEKRRWNILHLKGQDALRENCLSNSLGENEKELSAGPTPAKLNNHPALMALTDSFIIPRSFITRHIRLMVLLSFLLSAFLAPGVKYQTMRVFYQPYRIQLHKGDGGGGNTSSVLYFSRQSYQGISNPLVMIKWYPGCTERLCNETLQNF